MEKSCKGIHVRTIFQRHYLMETYQKVARQYFKVSGGSRTLYHVGKKPPVPAPRRWGGEWDRPWLPEPIREGVFLTPNPEKVWYVDLDLTGSVEGNVYVYEVPNWVIKDSGGINKWRNIREIIIPKHLWPHVSFQGKMRSDKWDKLRKEYYRRNSGFPSRPDIKLKGPRLEKDVGWKGILETDYPAQALSLLTEGEISSLASSLKESKDFHMKNLQEASTLIDKWKYEGYLKKIKKVETILRDKQERS